MCFCVDVLLGVRKGTLVSKTVGEVGGGTRGGVLSVVPFLGSLLRTH